MANVIFRIGGVPEHFNFPWRLAHSSLGFKPNGVDFEWKDYYGGTGYLREDLHNGTLDLAVMLTEGAVADINAQPGLRIVAQYVASPLRWGVHVHAGHGPASPDHLIDFPFAISRYGSGSHLMAFVYAQQKGWNPQDLQFVEVANLDGARKALAATEATTFLWEKFTTKPVVDSGEWRRIDICETPWPSFVVVGREDRLKEQPDAVSHLLEHMRDYLALPQDQIIQLIHDDLGLQKEDLQRWISQTSWDCRPIMAAETLESTQKTLQALGQVSRSLSPADYVGPFTEVQ